LRNLIQSMWKYLTRKIYTFLTGRGAPHLGYKSIITQLEIEILDRKSHEYSRSILFDSEKNPNKIGLIKSQEKTN
jgi:hypothetical protein